jgi:hypothetical protein
MERIIYGTVERYNANKKAGKLFATALASETALQRSGAGNATLTFE